MKYKLRNLFITILILFNLFFIFSCKIQQDGGDGGNELTLDELLVEAKNSITDGELSEMLYYLASDDLEGRLSGYAGNETAAQYIADEFENYGLEQGMTDSYLQPFDFNYYDWWSGTTISGTTSNIIGYLPGNDPELKDEIIVIGGHMDHIGYNYSSTGNQSNICNGADDNASGTVSVLELAEAFSLLKNHIKRTLVFICFSGEELGLFGSTHYVENPIFPIEDHVYMANMDMVGWLKEQNTIWAFGGNTSNTADNIIDTLDNNYSFNFSTDKGEYWAQSDHKPFYDANIPAVFFHTGGDSPYHEPEDDADLIDYTGLDSFTEFVFEYIWELDQLDEKPDFAN